MINWYFLRLVLLQIGLSLEATNWIMGCISSPNFEVLVNGEPTNFFKRSIGLRQVCHFSPILFLVIVEGLSKLIIKEKEDGVLEGINI